MSAAKVLSRFLALWRLPSISKAVSKRTEGAQTKSHVHSRPSFLIKVTTDSLTSSLEAAPTQDTDKSFRSASQREQISAWCPSPGGVWALYLRPKFQSSRKIRCCYLRLFDAQCDASSEEWLAIAPQASTSYDENQIVADSVFVGSDRFLAAHRPDPTNG